MWLRAWHMTARQARAYDLRAVVVTDACVRELMADRDHDHVVVTHGYAQSFVITTWLQVPVEAVGFASFAPRPGSITHLRHDDYWHNRTVVDLADTSHLNTSVRERAEL
jgi:probable phosphoglycerate mutase